MILEQLDIRRSIVTASAVLLMFSIGILTWRVVTLELNEQQDRQNVELLIWHEENEIRIIEEMKQVKMETLKSVRQALDMIEANHVLIEENNRLLCAANESTKKK